MIDTGGVIKGLSEPKIIGNPIKTGYPMEHRRESDGQRIITPSRQYPEVLNVVKGAGKKGRVSLLAYPLVQVWVPYH